MASPGKETRIRITFTDATTQEFDLDVPTTHAELVRNLAQGTITWLPVKYSGVINLAHVVMIRVLPQE